MDERLTALGPGTQSSMIGEPPPSPTMRPEGRPSVSWMVGDFLLSLDSCTNRAPPPSQSKKRYLAWP